MKATCPEVETGVCPAATLTVELQSRGKWTRVKSSGIIRRFEVWGSYKAVNAKQMC